MTTHTLHTYETHLTTSAADPIHFRRLVRVEWRKSIDTRAARWLLRTRPRPMDIGAEVARFSDGARAVAELLPGVLVDSERQAWQDRVAGLTDAGERRAVAVPA